LARFNGEFFERLNDSVQIITFEGSEKNSCS
jgi:hypothetical protein